MFFHFYHFLSKFLPHFNPEAPEKSHQEGKEVVCLEGIVVGKHANLKFFSQVSNYFLPFLNSFFSLQNCFFAFLKFIFAFSKFFCWRPKIDKKQKWSFWTLYEPPGSQKKCSEELRSRSIDWWFFGRKQRHMKKWKIKIS